MNPPDKEWKEETTRYLKRWTGTSLEYREEDALIKLAFPHTRLMKLWGMDTAFLEPFQKLLLGHRVTMLSLETL